ncbi:Alpha/Beta hydrolase protein [Pelagophyceae sp. CCMP2097]|nr:Alpha/Beta hydrolase protein [Pelagophyceae sp. CCMP2097]
MAERRRRASNEGRGDAEAEAAPKPPSFVQQVQLAYEQVVAAIIRPPRTQYAMHHLGPMYFNFLGKNFGREDFVVYNSRGHALQCSRWAAIPTPAPMMPTIIFMHGNASARVEALPQLSVCLSLGISVVSFDFSGSGLSDGEFVTLGAWERYDIRAVVDYLRGEGKTSTIAFWGRSMGAVTALLYADEDNMLDAMVLDSPFASLKMLAEELVQKATANSSIKIPKFAVAGVLRLVRASIKKRAQVDIDEISAISHVQRMFVPALFCVVRGDSFISNKHSEMLHAQYAGDKFILAVDGDHNEVRPPAMHVFVRRFLQRYMQVPANWALETRESIFTTVAPWHATHGRVLSGRPAGAGDPARTIPRKELPTGPVPEPSDAYSANATTGEQTVGMGRAAVHDVVGNVANLFDAVGVRSKYDDDDDIEI